MCPALASEQSSEESKSSPVQKTPPTQSVFSKQVAADFGSFTLRARKQFTGLISEKLWRMQMAGQINSYVRGENRQIKESLNMRHNLGDLNLYSLTKRQVVEEDVFGHIFPFCMINCTGLTVFMLRRTSWKIMALGGFLMLEYIYFLFNFPVEAWHFHRRALQTDLPYAQMLRDSYSERFPDTRKAEMYRRIDEKETERFQALRTKLKIN